MIYAIDFLNDTSKRPMSYTDSGIRPVIFHSVHRLYKFYWFKQRFNKYLRDSVALATDLRVLLMKSLLLAGCFGLHKKCHLLS